MPETPANSDPTEPAPAGRPKQYVVVARRYRPQTFEDLIGQQHVAKALSNAITTNRVGHAYLFTGARGVGKTSAARIFAKAINCETGPVPVPCNRCDLCESISSGEDMDVLEIDGASNRGIDEIRQLRQNAGVCPSRSRCKIYIIDEVHMLTREAFNALLKTLEEPPEHVKFIFCTTEPTKIPVTILSRCQRFDFAGILWRSIAERLEQIVHAEGVAAEPEALQILARRATGSMRDAQSLLEQLLAFAPEKIAVADVHAMLGSAGEERLAAMVGHLVRRDASAALAELDAAIHQGVDVGQLVEQLFGYLRDSLTTLVGCSEESFLYAAPGSYDEVAEAGQRWGLTTLMAAMQILDQTLSRLRYSTQARLLAELAMVQIASLEDLDELGDWIARLEQSSGDPPPMANRSTGGATPPSQSKPVRSATREKKTAENEVTPPKEPGETPSPPKIVLTDANVVAIWSQALAKIPGTVAQHANQFDRIAISAPNCLVVHFKSRYNLAKSVCSRPEQLAKFEAALAEVTGERIRVEFSVGAEKPDDNPDKPVRPVSPQQRLAEIAQHPMIQRAGELFDAQPIRVDEPPTDA